jgi:hypothetical protein
VKPKTKQQTVWEIELDWGGFKQVEQLENPLARAAEITWSTSLLEQPTEREHDGKFCCTTAGERLTGIVEQIPLVEYDITKNLAGDPAWILTHFGAVNSDPVKLRGITWAPKTLLCAGGSGGKYQTENKVEFAEFRLKLIGDYRGWTVDVWNRGTVRLERQERTQYSVKGRKLVATKKLVWCQVPITVPDENGVKRQIEEPVFLNDFGQEIVDLMQPEKGNTVDASKFIQLKFEIQRPKQFKGVLPLV